MTVDKAELFRLLDPPPGGLERMRRRLEEPRVAPWEPLRRWQTAAALGIAFALALAVTAPLLVGDHGAPEPERDANLYAAREFDRLLGRRLEAVELRVAIDDKSAVISEVESSRRKIRIYELELREP
jgi:hypothetical protein